jgi:hypothetical protein
MLLCHRTQETRDTTDRDSESEIKLLLTRELFPFYSRFDEPLGTHPTTSLVIPAEAGIQEMQGLLDPGWSLS